MSYRRMKRRFLKRVKRFFFAVILILIAALVVNAKTNFFKNIDTYIPYLDAHYPYLTEYISDLSDDVNEFIYSLPTPSELWAQIRNTELPIDPDDVAYNAYYQSDTMLNFYNAENISVAVTGNELDVYGVAPGADSHHLVYRFLDTDGAVLGQYTDSTDSDGKFRKIMRIPDFTNQFVIFTGPERLGEFSSAVYNYVYLTQSSADGNWSILDSPVYSSNLSAYEKDKSVSTALKSTYAICSSDSSVKALAESITTGYASDYEKALKLHDWICDNIYYDNDSIQDGTNNAAYVATDVLATKRAVCLGYANLYAALCRSLKIPCNVVTGYALGLSDDDETAWNESNISTNDANHAWNEVYLDNRWVIVDATWDSRNKIKNSEAITDGLTSHLYFDANIKFFSVNHRIMEYIKK